MNLRNYIYCVLIYIISTNLLFAQNIRTDQEIQVEFPENTIQSIPFQVNISLEDPYNGPLDINIHGDKQEVDFKNGQGKLEITSMDNQLLSIEILGQRFDYHTKPIPLWWSIFPPLLAIALALIFREVVTSLFAGILFGAVLLGIYADGFKGILYGFMRTIDHFILEALSDSGHMSIIIFSMLIGGTVAVISRNGGMQGIVNIIALRARNVRSGQFSTWLLGVVIFFDDYANSLVVGNTMRPVTDRLKISREKLAYIVDSTAAPIASVAFVTTWIGAELGYIQDAIQNLSTLDEGVYTVFLSSLQYAFYPVFALIFILFIIFLNKDFGPMYRAEKRARTTGLVSSVQTLTKLDHDDLSEFTMKEGIPARWYNAGIPIFVIIGGTIAGLIYTGWNQEIWEDPDLTLGVKMSEIIGGSDSYLALMWSSLAGLLMAAILSMGQKSMKLGEVIVTATKGFKTMFDAIIILTLAWSLAAITAELHTAEFLTGLLVGNVPPVLIPAITLVLAALIAFSTGTSWGTMAILYPIILPTAWIMTESAGYDYGTSLMIFHNVTASVLAGSVLGDHCSPISDTTILSSLASSCNHIDHVRTQLPYALTIGAVALTLGTLPAAFGIPPWILFAIGILVLYFIVRLFGKSVPEPVES